MATYWTENWNEIAERIKAPPRLLIACDFDGTLAPFVANPNDVIADSDAITSLRDLSVIPGITVAIITGRSLSDIMPRIPVSGLIYAGNHGLELKGLGLDGEKLYAIEVKENLDEIAGKLQGALGDIPGVLIENKGLSLTVHLRNAARADHQGIVSEVVQLLGPYQNLKIQYGHMVVELLPDIGLNKGTAVKQILGRLGLPASAAFYVGDDTTDESVFSTLQNGLTFKVGVGQKTAARWAAADVRDVCRILKAIVDIRSPVSGVQPEL